MNSTSTSSLPRLDRLFSRRGRHLQVALIAGLALTPTLAPAVYRSNISGVVTNVMTYSDVDQIYFTLNNQPTIPACDSWLFSIDASTPPDRRKALQARLLLSLASKEPVNIGFDDQGDCSHGYIRVHRVG